jgi:hypothetical protein
MMNHLSIYSQYIFIGIIEDRIFDSIIKVPVADLAHRYYISLIKKLGL